MKPLGSALGAIAGALVAPLASATTVEQPPPGPAGPPAAPAWQAPPQADEVQAARRDGMPPPAHEGFQLALRLGWMIPSGRASGAPGDTLSGRYGGQFPLLVDLGIKVSEALYLGGYGGISFGGAGGDPAVERACDDDDDDLENDISCSSTTMRLGIEARYGFRPAERVNPWLGLGIGPTVASQTIEDRVQNRRERTTASGWEWARPAVGLDFRPVEAIGLSLSLTAAVGRYSSVTTSVNEVNAYDGPVDDPTVHVWVTPAVGMVIFP